MKYFILFVLISYSGGLLFGKVNRRLRLWLLFALCLLLTFAFYFLDKI